LAHKRVDNSQTADFLMETYTQKYCFPYKLIFTCTLYVISRKKIKETLPLVLFMIKAKT
jgi:hypothetical protein